MTRVELFERIRQERILHGKSIRQIAAELHVHRRAVRQAIKDATPPKRRPPERLPTVLTTSLRQVIDTWLLADQDAPRKQRHTARRIFHRLANEHDFQGGETTVRRYVRLRRRELFVPKDTFVPRDHLPGHEAEVDWYEADVDFPTGRQRIQFFQMRACYSGREFHMAFHRQNQLAFLEAHAAAFAYFGGTFERIRYDNLGSAVQAVLRGRRRRETDRFVALRSHYLFESQFCLPGKEGAHEKGGVEGGVGRFRRNSLVPVPAVDDLAALNRYLAEAMAKDDQRRITGRSHTIAEEWAADAEALRPLPAERFQTIEPTVVRVDSMGRICVATNRYSVPIRLAGRTVEVRLGAATVEVISEGKAVALHERLYLKNAERLVLDHYLDLLWQKPGALAGSRPLRQARERREWPGEYDALWQALKERHGEQEGTRQMVGVLLLHRQAPKDRIDTAVGLAMNYGCLDLGAITTLLRQLGHSDPCPAPLTDLGHLHRYDRPIGDLSVYALLLNGRAC